MVEVRPWESFVQEIDQQNKKFYLYGAGNLYKQIIYSIDNKVIGVIDRNAEQLRNKHIKNLISIEEIRNIDDFELPILCLLNPYNRYRQRVKEVQESLSNLIIDKNIIIYCIDDQVVKDKGTIDLNGKKLLIDKMTFIIHNDLEHMNLAYKGKESLGPDYLNQLYNVPYCYVLTPTGLGLPDFHNGLIDQVDGKMVTDRKYQDNHYHHKIWLFGDSRVYGFLNESKDTFASALQKKIDDANMDYMVVNCGIPGRDIERMVYQIQHEDIQTGDYVVLGTGFYEYDEHAYENALVWSEYIKDASAICKQKKAEFFYLNLPTILEMTDLSDIEKKMLELFQTTEFTEYTPDIIRNYKDLIRCVCTKNGILYYDLKEGFENRSKYGQVFINMHHYGPYGNLLIGDEIYRIIMDLEKMKSIDTELIDHMKIDRTNQLQKKISTLKESDREITNYINHIQNHIHTKVSQIDLVGKRIGAIVMNANPFTNGHRYLVEEALKDVDYLIVFVVSEDRSVFSFKDRFHMVSKNLEDLDHVLVVPSGKYCISSFTFPAYFKKEILQDQVINSTKDLELFAQRIAPELAISIRFVGEEPTDYVTKQYNEAMKKILPLYQIDVVEIKRKSINDNVISASTVRRYMKEKNQKKIETLVPKVTYDYICNHYLKCK